MFIIHLLITCILVEEIDFEIGHFHNFQTSTTMTLDWVTWHTIVYHASNSIYTPNFAEIRKTFCGWMYICLDGH